MSGLLAIYGKLFGGWFPIREELTIGRAPGVSVLLPDLQVSRLHALIRRCEDGFEVVDAQSRNGTMVNGERVLSQRPLLPGDELQIGNSRFLFAPMESLLPVRYEPSWVIVSRSLPEPLDAHQEAEEQTHSERPFAALYDDAELLRDWLSEPIIQATSARALLERLLDRFSAERGALIELGTDGQVTPLTILPSHQNLSLNGPLLDQCREGSTVNFLGDVKCLRFERKGRLEQQTPLAILAIPWRLGGHVEGVAWLERSAASGRFGPLIVERLEGFLALAAPALVNARYERLSSRRQRATRARVDGERIPGWMVLENSGLTRHARDLAAGNAAIFIVGSRGTAKDRVARTIHAWSARSKGPLVSINCARLSAAQAEVGLFGVAGSLTYDEEPFLGKLELADGGTLVLELVDALAPTVQDALLRVLTLGQLVRRGEDRPTPIDVRLISTSGVLPSRLVKEERLRKELIPLLGEEVLTLPCLDEIRSHVIPLANALIGRLSLKMARSCDGLAPAAEEALAHRDWVLNLWELEDLIIRGMALGDGKMLTREDLDMAEVMPVRAAPSELAVGQPPPSTLRDVERRLLIQALRLARGHRGEASDLMGITRQVLEQKIRMYAIEPRKL